VAAAAERLVVLRVPEAREIALVGDDVINDARRDDTTGERAEGTEGMRTEEGERVASPPRVVEPFGW
jgi:hypothetical protein